MTMNIAFSCWPAGSYLLTTNSVLEWGLPPGACPGRHQAKEAKKKGPQGQVPASAPVEFRGSNNEELRIRSLLRTSSVSGRGRNNIWTNIGMLEYSCYYSYSNTMRIWKWRIQKNTTKILFISGIYIQAI